MEDRALGCVGDVPVKLKRREMLRKLLDCGQLAPSEAEAVRKLYEDIDAGRVGGMD